MSSYHDDIPSSVQSKHLKDGLKVETLIPSFRYKSGSPTDFIEWVGEPAQLDPNSSKLSRLISRPLLSELCSWESVVSTVLYVPVDFTIDYQINLFPSQKNFSFLQREKLFSDKKFYVYHAQMT